MRILFAGTPDFAVPALRALLAEHEVLAVFTQPDRASGRGRKLQASAVKLAALEAGISVLQPTDKELLAEQVCAFEADLMVVVAYGMILPGKVLQHPRYGCINIHASLLPRWRGAAPIQRAIEAGDAETGVSIMQMEAGLDSGPVLSSLRTDISAEDTSQTLHDRLAQLGATAIQQALVEIAATGLPEMQRQDDSLVTYAHKIRKQEAQLDWHQPATKLHRRIRALQPWPVCETRLAGHRLRIWQARVVNAAAAEAPGTITDIDAEGILVACGEGQLRLQQLQQDGGRKLAAREFCNGFKLSAGQRFD